MIQGTSPDIFLNFQTGKNIEETRPTTGRGDSVSMVYPACIYANSRVLSRASTVPPRYNALRSARACDTSSLCSPFKTAACIHSDWSASENGNRRISCLEIFRCKCLSPLIPRTCASWHHKTNRRNTLPSGPLVKIWLQHPACLR
jgi:hypothetical protein